MTDREINEAIARFCGWKSIKTPDYCNDLNLMHEAEKLMNEEHWCDYIDFMPGIWQEAVHATARQRAEAFLRTLGKWEEAK